MCCGRRDSILSLSVLLVSTSWFEKGVSQFKGWFQGLFDTYNFREKDLSGKRVSSQ
jgi:hypothetical protein